MSLFSRMKRRFVFAAIFALLLFGALLPMGGGRYTPGAIARAYPYEEIEITYYSDPGHTNYVGTGHIYCNGHGTLTGTSSPYHTEEQLNVCCYGVPC